VGTILVPDLLFVEREGVGVHANEYSAPCLSGAQCNYDFTVRGGAGVWGKMGKTHSHDSSLFTVTTEADDGTKNDNHHD
jgi:hypothetical protein